MQQFNNFKPGGSIDINNYATGVYILKVVDENNNTEIIRIVKIKG